MERIWFATIHHCASANYGVAGVRDMEIEKALN